MDAYLALEGFLMAGSAAAQQAPDTVFGMELNAPLSIPECRFDKDSRIYFPAAGSCYKRDQVKNGRGEFVDAEGPLGNEQAEIHFAFKNRPAIVSGYKVRAALRGGELASVGTRTGGISTQAQDLSQLEEKYGKPTRHALNRSPFRMERVRNSRALLRSGNCRPEPS